MNSQVPSTPVSVKSVTVYFAKTWSPSAAVKVGDANGMVFNEDGEAFLDKAQYRVQWMVDTGGMVAGGYKKRFDFQSLHAGCPPKALKP